MALDLHIGTVGGARLAVLTGDEGVVAVIPERSASPDLTGAVYRARVLRYDATADQTILDLGSFEAVLPGKAPSVPVISVQVRRLARDGKRPEVSADIVLAGRFIVAAPGINDVKVSGRMRNGRAERERARDLGLTNGWILRRAFTDADDEAVSADALRLSGMVSRLGGHGQPGQIIPATPIWCRIALDEGEPTRIFATKLISAKVQSDLRDLGLDPSIVGEPMDLGEIVAPLCEPEVGLAKGGRITIELTRALAAIDVDAGGASHEAANQAAVRAIARQLRLRNIGGIVVVDLVSQKSDWRPVVDSFRRALADDPVRTSIAGGVSPLGLLQMSRERRGLSLSEALD